MTMMSDAWCVPCTTLHALHLIVSFICPRAPVKHTLSLPLLSKCYSEAQWDDVTRNRDSRIPIKSSGSNPSVLLALTQIIQHYFNNTFQTNE